jgi:acetyl-CoA C-acetyltransferase
MNMTEFIIAGAARTPVGAFNGALGGVSASDLGKAAIEEALKRAGVAARDV